VSRRTILASLPRLATGAAVLALGLGGLTACGGGDSGSSAAATSTTASSAAPSSADSPASASSDSGSASEAEALKATETNFKIKLDEDHIKAGSYTITVVNDGEATHDLAVEQNGTTMATSDSIGPGEKTTLKVDLAPGQYVFYCSIGNHRAMGMQIDVTVT
jgi:plastocyanin